MSLNSAFWLFEMVKHEFVRLFERNLFIFSFILCVAIYYMLRSVISKTKFPWTDFIIKLAVISMMTVCMWLYPCELRAKYLNPSQRTAFKVEVTVITNIACSKKVWLSCTQISESPRFLGLLGSEKNEAILAVLSDCKSLFHCENGTPTCMSGSIAQLVSFSPQPQEVSGSAPVISMTCFCSKSFPDVYDGSEWKLCTFLRLSRDILVHVILS